MTDSTCVLLPSPPEETLPPGTWRRMPDGMIVATCPECGTLAVLRHGTPSPDCHEIDDQGKVTPSVVCPGMHGQPCSFHRYVLLEGWDPG